MNLEEIMPAKKTKKTKNKTKYFFVFFAGK